MYVLKKWDLTFEWTRACVDAHTHVCVYSDHITVKDIKDKKHRTDMMNVCLYIPRVSKALWPHRDSIVLPVTLLGFPNMSQHTNFVVRWVCWHIDSPPFLISRYVVYWKDFNVWSYVCSIIPFRSSRFCLIYYKNLFSSLLFFHLFSTNCRGAKSWFHSKFLSHTLHGPRH